MSNFVLFPTLACLVQAPPVTPAPTPPAELHNGSFTEGEPGQMPAGWFVSKPARDAGFRAEIETDGGLPGRRSIKVFRESGSGLFGNLMQILDAAPYRGKRVRLRSTLRVEGRDRSAGQLWLRVDLPGQQMGFFDNMDGRPVRSDAWTTAEIVGDVAEDAKAIALGVMLTKGNGPLHSGPVTLEILGSTPAQVKEGPRPLTDRGLRNLAAFARAFNYLRFFHPSDQAAQADWNRLAAEGVRAVEGAATPKELAARLNAFFAPVAPTARFVPAGKEAEPTLVPAQAIFAVRWNHTGFGQGQLGNIYHSSREYLSLAELKGKGWPDPDRSRTMKLGEGVHMFLPLVCVADATKATLPKTQSAPTSAAEGLQKPTAGFSGTGDDRATRLGDVVLAWGVFQHFYPYFDVVKTDWDAELDRALARAATDVDGRAFAGTLRRLVTALHDGHGGVFGVGEPAAWVPSLGLTFAEGKPVVSFSLQSAASIPIGSRILEVDGVPIEGVMAQLKEEISAATSGWMETQLRRRILEGPASAAAKVGYQAPNGARGTISLPRDVNPWELDSKDPRRLAPMMETRPGIWYVDLSLIDEKSFNEAMPKLASAKGVVFDLRGYPRTGRSFLQHLTDKPIESARWNVPVATLPNREGWQWNTSGRWNLEPLQPRIRGKVAFLTGGGAISYAESCLGIVEAYKLAEIVGEPSAGTNGNVNPIELPGGYRITWTGMKVLKHDGSRHHGVGILPTVPVKPTAAGVTAGRDEVLEKGIEVVSR